MVQWLRLHVSTAGAMGLNPVWGTKISYAIHHSQKKRENRLAVAVCVWGGGGVVVKMNNLIYKVTKSNLKNNHNDDDLLSLAHAQYLPSIISLDDPSIPVKLALELIILLIIPSFTGKETKPWRGRS